ncbi:MAG TPA: hypothetical protein VFP72_01925 [Kineosporiaceae bacterium]|nr:hypothetical protein [Kineosporiaceae bacterium]
MSVTADPGPGFLALSSRPGAGDVPDVAAIAAAIGATGVDVADAGGIRIARWGLARGPIGDGFPVQLSLCPRRLDHDLTPEEVQQLLAGPDRQGLAQVLPPFAAATLVEGQGLVAAVDRLGLRHLYTASGPYGAAVSTSARALALLEGPVLDREAVALQSRLGAQLRQRTLYRGVEKTSPGTLIRLRDGAIGVERYDPREPLTPVDPDLAAREAAAALRAFMSAYLDDHPGAVLQLTGGLDTRVLLAAVDEKRRRTLRAMTLTTPGSEDVRIAVALAQRYGMSHHLLDLQPMTEVTHDEANTLCLNASAQVGGMADPLAFAAVSWAEARLEQRERLSGSSGEIGRGLYFWGRGPEQAVEPALVRQLAAWRMFANQSVSAAALHPDFAAWSGEFAADEIVDLFTAAAPTMFAAGDEVYLWQRNQRWSGVLESASCLRRSTMSPMTDPRYLQIVTAVPPEVRRGSRFLARLVTELDPELARIPMEGRPAPAVFADPSLANRARVLAMLGRKGFRKARQRLARRVKPPLGAQLFATRFVEHLREDAGCLDAVAGLDVFDPVWLKGLATGESEATPADLALVVNLAQAFATT